MVKVSPSLWNGQLSRKCLFQKGYAVHPHSNPQMRVSGWIPGPISVTECLCIQVLFSDLLASGYAGEAGLVCSLAHTVSEPGLPLHVSERGAKREGAFEMGEMSRW